jgi:archaellum component FlaC
MKKESTIFDELMEQFMMSGGFVASLKAQAPEEEEEDEDEWDEDRIMQLLIRATDKILNQQDEIKRLKQKIEALETNIENLFKTIK